MLEEWGQLQRTWLYLQPIFGSPDIQRELPTTAAAFKTVDKMWRQIMASTLGSPQVLDACFQARIMENLAGSN